MVWLFIIFKKRKTTLINLIPPSIINNFTKHINLIGLRTDLSYVYYQPFLSKINYNNKKG